MESEPASSSTDEEGSEIGGFDEKVGGGIGHFGLGPPHDTAERDGSIGIGDDDHGLREGVGAVIDGFEGFFLFGGSNANLISLEHGEVECVERLSAFHHDVVGDIDDIIDGFDADGFETLGEPGGAWADGHTAKDAGGVAWAAIGILIDDLELGGDIGTGLRWLWIGDGEREVVEDSDFAGDAEVPEAVASIAGDFQVDNGIGSQVRCGFMVQAGERQASGEFIGLHFQRNILGQPIPRD